MTLERRPRPEGGHLVSLVECPACGADLREQRVATHLANEHGPADFGLAPLGERRANPPTAGRR